MEVKKFQSEEPVPDPVSTPERRSFSEVMEQRHENAVAALSIEKALFAENVENLKANELSIKAETLLQSVHFGSEDMKNAYKEAVKSYLLQKMYARDIDLQIQQILEEEQGIEFTPQNMANFLFARRVSGAPSGEIVCRREEDCFIMRFQEDYDFFRYVRGKHFKDTDLHGLTRGGYGQSKIFGVPFNEIVIRSSVVRPDDVLHERQHLLNRALNVFSDGIERGGSNDAVFLDVQREVDHESAGDKISLFRMVKDEFLARLRSNYRVEEIMDFTKKVEYSYLFDSFSESELADLKTSIFSIEKFLPELFAIFDKGDKRALLMYLLQDIPLFEMPRHLKSLSVYYGEKINADRVDTAL